MKYCTITWCRSRINGGLKSSYTSIWFVMLRRKIKVKESKIMALQRLIREISEETQLMMEEYEDHTVSVNSKIVKPIKGGTLMKI